MLQLSHGNATQHVPPREQLYWNGNIPLWLFWSDSPRYTQNPHTLRCTNLTNTSLFLLQLKHAIQWYTTILQN